MDISIGFETYIDYVYIKTHFTMESFNWNYNSVYKRIPFETYLKRRDCKLFTSLHLKYPNRIDRCNLIISSFLLNSSCHISDIYFDDEIKMFHTDRMGRVKSLEYVISKDIANLADFMYDSKFTLRDLFISNGELPLIFKKSQEIFGGITDETLSVLDKGLAYTEQSKSDPLWSEIAFKLKKYKPFLTVESSKIKQYIENLS